MECMCLIFDLSCRIPCGWVADKCVWNCSLFANLSRSNQFVATETGRRLGWRRKDSQKVFDHVWYAQVPVILHPFKKEILKTKCFQRTEGFPSFSSAVSTRKLLQKWVFFPVLWILPSRSGAHDRGQLSNTSTMFRFMWTYYSNENILVAEHEPQVFKWQFMFEEGKGPSSHV